MRSDLTAKEQENVRIALRYLRVRTTGWKALGCEPDTLADVVRGTEAVSARMAFRVARFAGSSIDGLLAGEYPPAGTCAHCGHGPDVTDETAH